MLLQFQEYVRQQELFLPEEPVLLAVSGGMDSIAMAELFHRNGSPFGIAHCNFSLRGAESDAEEKFVKDLSLRYGVELFVKRFDTASYAQKNKVSIQMAARELRYEWFEEILAETNYRYVATAHQLDDQVESFLINLSRGTGLAGLHGILPKTGNIIRPVLFASRHEIKDFIESEKIDYKEDSSNQEVHYLRNRMRHIVIPELEKSFPEVRNNILNTISNIRHAEELYRYAIDEKSGVLLKKTRKDTRIDKKALGKLHPLKTWAYELLKPYGFNSPTCEKVIQSLEGEPGRWFYSPTHRLLSDRDELVIMPLKQESAKKDKSHPVIKTPRGATDEPVKLSWEQVPADAVTFNESPNVVYLDMDKLVLPLALRKWRRGDYFYPLGMNGRKKISDYFIDEKLSRYGKEKAWLLCSEENIVCILGQRIDERYKITPGTKVAMEIQYFPED